MPVKIIFSNSNFKNPSVEQLLRDAGLSTYFEQFLKYFQFLLLCLQKSPKIVMVSVP